MANRLQGRAGGAETAEFAQRHAALGGDAFTTLGRTGLTISRAGFGGYRVHPHSPEHGRALREALTSGINLIDTSSNYTDGGSETLVGQVLAELVGEGTLRREEVVIVTKAGYLQGQNWEVAVRREEEGRPFPEVVKLGPDLWHCIHPEFLEDQITRSLSRLGAETIDVLLLHNPEYFLEAAKMSGRRLEDLREEYARRIEAAFGHLESEVARGRIACHGISSNTFVEPASDFKFTSLERCWEAAMAVSKAHHFRVIQMPGNLVETGLVRERNQRRHTLSVLDLAAEVGLGVLINRPLNAFTGQEMVRLAEYPLETDGTPEAVKAGVQELLGLEQQLTQRLPEAARGTDEAPGPLRLLCAGGFLRQNWAAFGARDHWQEFADARLLPQIRQGLQMIGEFSGEAEKLEGWRTRYAEAVSHAVIALRDLLSREDAQRATEFLGEIAPLLPEDVRGRSLSQVALWALAALPAVSCVLVGMRRREYVRNVVAALQLPRADPSALWASL